jgi:hypothetical protein
MKTVTKLVMGAAALVATVGAAHATQTTNPSTGASNLVFFVNDTTQGTTYSIVLTGEGVGSATNSLFTNADALSSSTQGSLNTLNGDASFSIGLAGNTALQSFISGATTAGDTLQWGVIGAAYAGTTPLARETAGAVQVVTTAIDSTSLVSEGESSIDGAVPADLNTDVKNVSSKTPDAFGGTTPGIFGTSASAGNVGTLYGTGGDVAGAAIGSSYGLYGLTTNGTSGHNAIAYDLGEVSFNGTTLSFTGNVLATPLPAAAWLFGSGLLGLLGIGRRRDIKVA